MFGKVFASLWQGSMVGRSDAQLVFVYMIANAGPDGILEVTPEVISALIGLPLARVQEAIDFLLAPDPRSRSRAEDGRRLVPLDAERGWGWRIVNHALYRAMRDEEFRRAANRERMRKSRGAPCAAVRHRAPPCAQAEAEAEADSPRPTSPLPRSASRPSPAPGGRPKSESRKPGDGRPREINGSGPQAPPAGLSPPGTTGCPSPVEIVALGPTFPIRGRRSWVLAASALEELSAAFPAFGSAGVVLELARARLWLESDPKRQKTGRGMPRFLFSWLARAQGHLRAPVPLEAFERFWSVFPRQDDREAALEAFAVALTRSAAEGVDADDLVALAGRFAERVRRDGTEARFVPKAARWLRDRSFMDHLKEDE